MIPSFLVTILVVGCTGLQVPVEMDGYYEGLPRDGEAYRERIPIETLSRIDALPDQERARIENFSHDLPGRDRAYLAYCVMEVTKNETDSNLQTGKFGEGYLGMLDLPNADLCTPEGLALDAHVHLVNQARAIVILEKYLAYKQARRIPDSDDRGNLYVFSLAAAEATRSRARVGTWFQSPPLIPGADQDVRSLSFEGFAESALGRRVADDLSAFEPPPVYAPLRWHRIPDDQNGS